jgi:hypothetical protein
MASPEEMLGKIGPDETRYAGNQIEHVIVCL